MIRILRLIQRWFAGSGVTAAYGAPSRLVEASDRPHLIEASDRPMLLEASDRPRLVEVTD